jgi:hypothetical protein
MAEKFCGRCNAPERDHVHHPIKNPNKAGTTPGSRCKGWVDPVPHEGGKARQVPSEVNK